MSRFPSVHTWRLSVRTRAALLAAAGLIGAAAAIAPLLAAGPARVQETRPVAATVQGGCNPYQVQATSIGTFNMAVCISDNGTGTTAYPSVRVDQVPVYLGTSCTIGIEVWDNNGKMPGIPKQADCKTGTYPGNTLAVDAPVTLHAFARLKICLFNACTSYYLGNGQGDSPSIELQPGQQGQGQQGQGQRQQGQGQQGQGCQLTEAQQQELIARAQDQQAASDQRFQSSLLKNLLSQAALKAGSANLSAQLSGKTGLSPQDVANLIKNGSITPADMATAILQTLQELGESSGDTAIDTCAGSQAGSSSGNAWYSAADDGTTPGTDQQLADAEQQFDQENWASLPPAELGQKIAQKISTWVSGRTKAICDLVTRAHLPQQAAAEAANEAAKEFGGTGGIVQMGDSLVVAPSAPGQQAPAIAVAPDGTVTPAFITREWDPNTLDFVNTNLRPRS
jgi:hypothetical protein